MWNKRKIINEMMIMVNTIHIFYCHSILLYSCSANKNLVCVRRNMAGGHLTCFFYFLCRKYRFFLYVVHWRIYVMLCVRAHVIITSKPEILSQITRILRKKEHKKYIKIDEVAFILGALLILNTWMVYFFYERKKFIT